MSPVVYDPVPVVMLGSGHHGGLGIARSLGRLRIPVYSVDTHWWESAVFSRYCRRRFLVDIGGEPPELAAARLQSIARQIGGRPILIPTTDQACIWAAQHTKILRQDFRFPAQDAGLVQTLCDKSRMQKLAAEHGVPTAQSTLPRSKEDVAQFIEGASFPVMVKETCGGRLRSRAGRSKFLVHTARELTDLYEKAGDPEAPNLILQEFIPGEDWMFDGYFDSNSRCLFGMTGSKIRRFPVDTGVTSLGICTANETVMRITADFMRAIHYHGILDIGYRRDRRDGRYKVLDVNPRIGCTFRLFTAANGLDVARALYLDITGQPVGAAEGVDGRKWVVEDFDLISALQSWRQGRLSIKEWIRSFAGVQEAACFSLDDPLPFFMMAMADCCELFHWTRGRAAVESRLEQTPAPVPLASSRRY